MIEVKNLTKYYGSLAAIKDISFTVERGEILGFLGPNAAGKTTTMRILTCFFPPTEGTARVAGFDIFTDSLEVRRRTGYLPENVPVYPEMRIRDYLDFVGSVKGLLYKERKNIRNRVMADCGLADQGNKIIKQLSKGYRQRLGLAQALINDPEVLILDEPTIGLDPKQIIEIRELIKNLSGKRTVILSTHILPEVSIICQRVVIINEGKLVAIDTPENLTHKLEPTRKIIVQIEGPKEQIVDKLNQIHGVTNVQVPEPATTPAATPEGTVALLIESDKELDIRKDVANAVVGNNWGLLEMRPLVLTLEDIFVKLVTKE